MQKYIKKFGMWQTKQIEFFHLQTDHGPVLQHSIVGSYRVDSRWCYFGNPLFGEQ